MKLNATITTDTGKTISKASNESIKIEVKGESRETIFEFEVTQEKDCYKIKGYSIDENSTDQRKSERYFEFEPNKK
tara:strand:+ start:3604 stop:3831 length:228 start_codon:yes stop_codon:yes gene_type:complete